jgi:uncharacterized protein (TIGR03546 family)
MFVLRFIWKLLGILNSNISPKQIAGGIALGMILGLTPFFSLHNLLIILLICIIRVRISAVILSAIIFGLISYLVNPVSSLIGYFLLVNAGFLKPLWTALYNMPVIAFSNFNNTLVLGSLVLSLILFYPILIFSAKGVVSYRNLIGQKTVKG